MLKLKSWRIHFLRTGDNPTSQYSLTTLGYCMFVTARTRRGARKAANATNHVGYSFMVQRIYG